MPNSSFYFAGLAVLLAAGVTTWLVRQRRARDTGIARVAARAPASAAVPVAGPVASSEVEPIAAPPFDILGEWQAFALGMEPPAASHPPRGRHATASAAAAAILARIETQPRYIPRRPLLLPQLMRTVNDPNASGKAIADIIGKDPALAGNLLRIASSPFYRTRSEPVESIERAVVMLGTDGIRQIIAAALVQPVMGSSGGAFAAFPENAWGHALLAAAASAEHAKLVERDDAFAAQLLGLVHGLGSIVVVQVLRDQYARQPGLVPDPRVASALLDSWAAPTASRIAEGWKLSGRIGEALAQPPGGSGALGRSLHFGRRAAALAMLCRQGRLDAEEADQLVATLDPRADAVAGIWKRMCAGVEPVA